MKKENTAIRLKKIMSDKNLRQIDVLNMTEPYCKKYNVKMNKSDISQYCSGKTEPNQNKLYVLSKALNVNEAWLMGFDVPIEQFDSDLLQKQKESRKQYAEKWNIQYFENKMLESFSELTDDNKKKSISYTENLLKNQILEEELTVKAAHNDNLNDPEEQQKIKRDLEKLVGPK